MEIIFYLTSAVALVASLLVIVGLNAIHALLYLVVSLLAVSLLFYLLGAPFAAGLQVIIYAGAIMVLFVFVIMMLNQGEAATDRERHWLKSVAWWGPFVLGAVLLGELLYVLIAGAGLGGGGATVEAQQVGIALFGPYLLAVELASLLLLAALVGAYRLGRERADGKR